MYLNHFDLCKKPFENTTNPGFFWVNDSFAHALSALEYALANRKGLILLNGGSGSGKTTLIHTFLETLGPGIVKAVIPDPDMAEIDFFNYLAADLDFKQSFASKGEFFGYFRRYLKEKGPAANDGRKILIVIDEAQRASNRLLNDIRLLKDLGADDETGVIVILSGQTSLIDKLSEPENASLKSRLTVNIRIESLNQSDTEKYIAHRLKMAGAQNAIFTSNARASVYQFSRGNPLQINNLCDRSLLTGYTNETLVIDSDIVTECAAELGVSLDANLNDNDGSAHSDHPETQSDLSSTGNAVIYRSLKLLVLAIAGAAIITLMQYSFISEKEAGQRVLEEQASTTFEHYQQQLNEADGDDLKTF